MNLLTDHSELLVESCQEKPFLALALDRALEGVPDQRAPWSRILVEAALRYENVAQRLDELAVRNQDHNHRGSREKAPLEAMTRPGSAYHRVLQQADVRSTEREKLPATSCLIKIGDSRFGGNASILRSTILMIIPFAVAGSVASGLFYSIFLFLESILGKEEEQPLPYPAIALIFTFLLVTIYILELTRAREFHFLLTLNTVNFNTDAGLHKTPTAAMIYLALSSYSARRDLRTLLRLLDIRNGTSSSDTPELNGLKLARHARARISGNSKS
ncbi:hypothetical protein [Nocardiopsis metallicus]|uniref:hypothetical protein n=1 Tax=Nocardiopsis metallicus TaxID=179819 RepID=UPI00161D32A3|nr:hypothetical protein [Nocardiopsis metallicus]